MPSDTSIFDPLAALTFWCSTSRVGLGSDKECSSSARLGLHNGSDLGEPKFILGQDSYLSENFRNGQKLVFRIFYTISSDHSIQFVQYFGAYFTSYRTSLPEIFDPRLPFFQSSRSAQFCIVVREPVRLFLNSTKCE